MKTINRIIEDVFHAMVIILCVVTLGIFVPIIASLLFSILITSVTFQDCLNSVPFWIATMIGILISSVYLGEINGNR